MLIPHSIKEAEVNKLKDDAAKEAISKAADKKKFEDDIDTLKMKIQELEKKGSKIVIKALPVSKLMNVHAGKKMKDIVPYNEDQEHLIREIIGFDFADDIPDEHDEGSEFVVNRAVKYLKADYTSYSGWMKNGKMNGRGTLLYEGELPIERGPGRRYSQRYDGIWRNGVMQGKGRYMDSNGTGAHQGVFAEDSYDTEGSLEYKCDGSIWKYNEEEGWHVIRAPKD